MTPDELAKYSVAASKLTQAYDLITDARKLMAELNVPEARQKRAGQAQLQLIEVRDTLFADIRRETRRADLERLGYDS